MDKLQQVKAKLEEMKAKYDQERDEEDFPNHSDGYGLYWSGVFACLKEISFFVDHLEVKEVDLEKEIEEHAIDMPMSEFTHESEVEDFHEWARKEFRYFFELGLKA